MNRMPLPIDPLLPQLIASLRGNPNLVLQADPGAGKTTRVPPALLEAGLLGGDECWILEPRRLAARLAATRVAEELGEALGQRAGYAVRFEQKVSKATRLRFVTEGLLLRRLQGDPQLRGISAIVLDEFHERHLHTDLAITLLRRLQLARRLLQRRDDALRAFPVVLEQVERHALRRLDAHAGQAFEGLDQRIERMGIRHAALCRGIRTGTSCRRAGPACRH